MIDEGDVAPARLVMMQTSHSFGSGSGRDETFGRDLLGRLLYWRPPNSGLLPALDACLSFLVTLEPL